MRRILSIGIACFLPTTFSPGYAFACSVCYGDPEAPLSRGYFFGILSLLLITATVLFGILLFMVSLYRRSHQFAENGSGETVSRE